MSPSQCLQHSVYSACNAAWPAHGAPSLYTTATGAGQAVPCNVQVALLSALAVLFAARPHVPLRSQGSPRQRLRQADSYYCLAAQLGTTPPTLLSCYTPTARPHRPQQSRAYCMRRKRCSNFCCQPATTPPHNRPRSVELHDSGKRAASPGLNALSLPTVTLRCAALRGSPTSTNEAFCQLSA